MFVKMMLAAALVAGLGDDNYRTREKAARLLVEVNNRHDLRPYLKAMASPDPEVGARVKQALVAYDEVWEGVGELPRIDAFDRSAHRRVFDLVEHEFDVLGIRSGPCGCEPFYSDEGARLASAQYVQALLDSGRTRQEVRLLIDAAVAKQVRVITKPVPRPAGPWSPFR